MTPEEIYEDSKKYTVFTWVAQENFKPLCIKKADGIYMWDYDGKRYTDICSQLVNVNIGFNNKAIIKAIQDQAAELAYIAPKHTYDKRAELGKILIE